MKENTSHKHTFLHVHAKSEVDGGLTLCMLGKFSCCCCRLLKIFKINFFNLKKIVQEYYQRLSVKWLRLGFRTRLFADDKSRR